jgi:maltooligosyltrehalose synthase
MTSECARRKQTETVLQELQELTADSQSRRETVLGRFFECQQLQLASALLAKAVEQCSRWRSGERLHPPGGSLPPSN